MKIRVMTEADLAPADELRQAAGWNQRPDEWRRLLGFEPQGCFVALEDGQVIGTVTTTTYGKEMAWIGMMLVHPDQRRRGLGTELMQKALDYLRKCTIPCIRLDATPAGRPLYEKLGFVAEWALTRHQAAPSGAKKAGSRDLVEADWPAVEKLDAAAFGAPRSRVLRSLSEGSWATLVCPPEGPILGYGMLRRGSDRDYLGPVVCDGPAATTLISALLSHAGGQPVFWDVPDDNPVATSLARDFGFTPVRPLTRMRFGGNSVPSDPKAQLAIADPSVG